MRLTLQAFEPAVLILRYPTIVIFIVVICSSLVVKYQVESRVEKQNNRPEGQIIYPSTLPHFKQVSVDVKLIILNELTPGRIGGHSFHTYVRCVSGTKASFNKISRVTPNPRLNRGFHLQAPSSGPASQRIVETPWGVTTE
jgi:hypothetical protein